MPALESFLTRLLFQLSQLCPEENLDKLIPCLAGPDPFYVERSHVDLEAGLRWAGPPAAGLRPPSAGGRRWGNRKC